jgi:hypothetical protein
VPNAPHKFLPKHWYAWEIVEAVARAASAALLSALTMQNESSDHPLAWLTFSARFPAQALCRAAVIASL